MSNDDELAYRIKMKFGTSPMEPTPYQLARIKEDIQALIAIGITPSEKDWAVIIRRYCSSAGTYCYAGADTTDLITLMQLATNK
ncbi:TPA: hypothetical protein H2X24_002502 [Salmonella enterica]|nr:hypothetical protein [Salmonella enterica]